MAEIPQINPDLEVHHVSLNERVSEQVVEDAGGSSSDDKLFLDSDAPIIEDITESEFSSDILKQNGYQVKNVDKKSLKSQKSKAEMNPVEKVVIKPNSISKPVMKTKTTTTLKPIVYVKSSTTHQGESSSDLIHRYWAKRIGPWVTSIVIGPKVIYLDLLQHVMD
ncbi:hypothetical protein R6Q59_013665 [Mikania micrantha]